MVIFFMRWCRLIFWWNQNVTSLRRAFVLCMPWKIIWWLNSHIQSLLQIVNKLSAAQNIALRQHIIKSPSDESFLAHMWCDRYCYREDRYPFLQMNVMWCQFSMFRCMLRSPKFHRDNEAVVHQGEDLNSLTTGHEAPPTGQQQNPPATPGSRLWPAWLPPPRCVPHCMTPTRHPPRPPRKGTGKKRRAMKQPRCQAHKRRPGIRTTA